MEWFSYVIAIGIGLAAVISPIVTALINNKHQLKLKNLEIYELAKRNALENFIKCASRCFDSRSLGNLYDYYNSLNNLYIYFSDIPSEVSNLENLNGSKFTNELNNIVIKLSSQIQKQ